MIIKRAMDWAIRNKIAPEQIAWAYTNPEYTYTDPVHQDNERRVRGDICLIIDPDGVILSILPAEHAQMPVERVKDIVIPKAKGGRRGTMYPTSYDEIVKMLHDLGYQVESSGSGHKNVLKDGALLYVLPSSASDYRTLKNTLSGLKKAGIDLRRAA